MLIAERLWARMGRRSAKTTGVDQRLLGGLARLGIATDLAEKLANEAALANQTLQEAQALAVEAQRDRTAAETAWREAGRIKAELEAASAAHAARSAELDGRAHVIDMRERELKRTLREVAALKTEYESKLAAFEAIVKGPVRRAE
jgi:DNA repair exonuclease SbcCD ATPase subunit